MGQALADTGVPPIKPGLWEFATVTEFDGRKPPTLRELLAAVPPDVREREERLAAVNHQPMDGEMPSQACLSAEFLASGRWHTSNARCDLRYDRRDDKLWRWHSNCADAETDAVIQVQDTTRYTFEATSTMKDPRAGLRTVHKIITARWLAPSCAASR
jgi:hypothetical protein